MLHATWKNWWAEEKLVLVLQTCNWKKKMRGREQTLLYFWCSYTSELSWQSKLFVSWQSSNCVLHFKVTLRCIFEFTVLRSLLWLWFYLQEETCKTALELFQISFLKGAWDCTGREHPKQCCIHMDSHTLSMWGFNLRPSSYFWWWEVTNEWPNAWHTSDLHETHSAWNVSFLRVSTKYRWVLFLLEMASWMSATQEISHMGYF